MHEFSLINDLMKKIQDLANDQNSDQVLKVKVWLGALSHISADHFREHFIEASNGSIAEGTLLAFEESLRIVNEYEMPDQPSVKVEPRAGTGYGCTEAPRGICYHRYTIDDAGIIQDAKIVSPTALNQPTIEKDLWDFVAANVHLPDDKLQWQCEQAIRNYDPCISCSTHFLKLHVERK